MRQHLANKIDKSQPNMYPNLQFVIFVLLNINILKILLDKCLYFIKVIC